MVEVNKSATNKVDHWAVLEIVDKCRIIKRKYLPFLTPIDFIMLAILDTSLASSPYVTLRV